MSTRRYARSLEPVPDDVAVRGTSRSAVSRRLVAATERQMDEWLGRDLGAIDLVVLMIDGVHVADHVLLVALGIDNDGKKHVLGVREGATENAAACTALLTDMCDRGLHTERAVLAVIDGAKALTKAIRDVYGARAMIQRSQAHKARNVTDQLPEGMRPSVRQALRDAYSADAATRAKRQLTNLVRRLRGSIPAQRRRSRKGSTRRSLSRAWSVSSRRRTRSRTDRLRPSARLARQALARRQDDPALDRCRCRRRRDALPSRDRTRDGMTRLVLALKDHETALAPVAPRRQAAS